jgi:integrase
MQQTPTQPTYECTTKHGNHQDTDTLKKIPFIPKEEELDALIAGCGPKTSTFLQLLKETAMRAGEAHALKWTDIDFETDTIRITPEKGSNPRIFKLSNRLKNMVTDLKSKSRLDHVFSKHLRTQRRLFKNNGKP